VAALPQPAGADQDGVQRISTPRSSSGSSNKHTDLDNFPRPRNLAKTVIQWMDATPQGFDPEVRAQLLVAYADIAFARQEFPRAVPSTSASRSPTSFEGTRSKRIADLKIAEGRSPDAPLRARDRPPRKAHSPPGRLRAGRGQLPARPDQVSTRRTTPRPATTSTRSSPWSRATPTRASCRASSSSSSRSSSRRRT